MFDGSLPVIFGTLFVGILAVFTAFVLVRNGVWIADDLGLKYLTGRDASEIDYSLVRGLGRALRYSAISLPLTALIAYGIGIIVENMTDYLVDVDTQINSQIILGAIDRLEMRILRKETEHRFLSLAKEDSEHYVFNGLGREVWETSKWREAAIGSADLGHRAETLIHQSADAFQIAKSEINATYKTTTASSDEVTTYRALARVVNIMYYEAKNWCYTEATYFDELSRIQNRIDWARSNFFICFWATIGSVVIVFAYTVKIMVLKVLKRRKAMTQAAADYTCAVTRSRLRRTALFLTCSVALCYLSASSYTHLERQFNERAFGYYLSHLKRNAVETTPGASPASSSPASAPEKR